MNKKHHQKIYNFYVIYKSPGAMMVTSENTRNDDWRPLNYEKPPKIRRFSYQSATVGLPIVNQSYHAHVRALHCGARREHCTLRDRALRLLGVWSWASSMFVSPISTMFSVVFSVWEQRRRAVDNSAGVEILSRFVTDHKKSWTYLFEANHMMTLFNKGS